MKLHPYTKQMVVCYTKEYLNRHFLKIIQILQDMEESRTITSFMSNKKKLLREVLRMLPLGGGHCYFCVYHDVDCTSCSYGKKHGKCLLDEKATYKKILHAKFKLLEAIEKYWEK